MDYLNRICSGLIALKFEGETYFYSYPSPKTLYKADMLENEIIANNIGVMTRAEALTLLYQRSKWSEAKEKEVEEEIPRMLESLKIELYLAYAHRGEIEGVRGKLQKVKNYLYSLLSKKNELDQYTIEGVARKEKILFLLKKQVKGLDVKPINLLAPYYSSLLSEGDIRKTARLEEWRVKWVGLKNGCKVFSGHLTEEQERLIKWSTIYDNIAESQEPPPDEVLNDDDALDGYFLYKKIETSDKQKLEQIEAAYANKGKKYTELYLPAANLEQARRNDLLNTEEARRTKQARFAQVASAGSVKEADFRDQRLKIDIAKNNLS